jgi:hypothetical protein
MRFNMPSAWATVNSCGARTCMAVAMASERPHKYGGMLDYRT